MISTLVGLDDHSSLSDFKYKSRQIQTAYSEILSLAL
jgi:hypothetical protein